MCMKQNAPVRGMEIESKISEREEGGYGRCGNCRRNRRGTDWDYLEKGKGCQSGQIRLRLFWLLRLCRLRRGRRLPRKIGSGTHFQ